MDDQTVKKEKKNWTHRKDNREQLISAGYKLLSTKGIEATTVKEVARLAGVSPGLFHYYFASKDELLMAVIYEAGASFSQQLMQEVRKLAAERSFSEVAMLAVAAVSRDHPTWYRLRYELYALGLRNPDFLPAVGKMLEKGRQGIAQTICQETGLDEQQAEAIAAIIHACTDGLALQQLAQPGLDLTASYRLVQSLLTAKPGDVE
ncbi:TetR/AcrR family transcriptional regulator [Ktedonosporobacter rubrisoli]|uniref:TetR/AcrR family transcriptional regulator n=1 Tax=Ktedonosporobacter rubrisoli TaxID=2509675 RepID=A0A4V0YYD5_KTERU|nr:TetR/AcrR family transcriptional regulator [Ktedonosporobacter rubrisoli]QBD75841.1 TetR/AcrR family transcriptional regulator [Ktedonosporobacter rubrisoli]